MTNPKNGNGKPILIFLGSSTPEKLRDFQYICETKNLPIYFKDVRDLLDAFHSAEEKRGKYKGNAEEKLGKVEARIRELINEHPSIIQEKCREYGIEYDPTRTYFASEDTGISLPPKIWAEMDKDGIDATTLAKIKTTQAQGGPAVETAPVISALLGSQRFMSRVVAAAKTLGYDARSQIPFTEQTTLLLKSFSSAATERAIPISAKAASYLYFTGPKSDNGRQSTYHWARVAGKRDVSAAEMGPEYVSKHSARAAAIDNLATQFSIQTVANAHSYPAEKMLTQMRLGILPANSNSTAAAETEKRFTKLGSNGRYRVFYPDAHDQTTAHELLGGIEHTVSGSDAILLLPDGNVQDEQSRFNKFYTLFSLIVAKQLIARDMQKPVIILNHDGSWDEAIANHTYLVNQGMTKDHSLQWPEQVDNLPRGVTIYSNAYFDEVKAGNEDDAYRAGLMVLDKKRQRYQRRKPANEVELEGGTAPDAARFHVAVFCSAGNENEKLNTQLNELGGWLAKEEFGVVYGAGDRYTMGALLTGVLQQRKAFIDEGMDEKQASKRAYIAGFSTPPILVSETQNARFPSGLSYYKQTKNIYDRMAGILSVSDAVVVAPGGAGTLQEWVAALMLKKMQPEVFGTKPIVVYNPALFKNDSEKKVWNMALKSLLGEDYALLTSEPANKEESAKKNWRCQELGIYVETELKEVEDRLENLRKNTNKWQARSVSFPALSL